MMLGIPKKLAHIWVGPLPPPVDIMKSWQEKHPKWEYKIYNNLFLKEFDFKTHKQISEYWKRGKFAGVADLMRLEILYEWGGFIPEADSICYHNTDELFTNSCIYTIYENEFLRGRLVSPIQAATPKNEFIGEMIERLSKINTSDLDDPWISTGNWFTAQMIEELNPNIVIFPSHYFIPIHYTGHMYTGGDKVYAKQLFGSTHRIYGKSIYGKESLSKRIKNFWIKREAKQYNQNQLNELWNRKKDNYNREF